MKWQQINLYQRATRTQWCWFSFQQILLLMGITILVLMSVSWQDYQFNQQLKRNINQLKEQKQQSQNQIDAYITTLPDEHVNQALKQQVQRLKQQYEASQQLQQMLSSDSLGNTQGFAVYLRGFAQHTVSGVWLSKIDLHAGGQQIQLSGYSRQAVLIPHFLQTLQADELFKQWQFQQFHLEQRPEPDGKVYFMLDTYPRLKDEKNN